MNRDQKRLMVLQAVKLNLNGKCSKSKNTCPSCIAFHTHETSELWDCEDCKNAFGYMINWPKYNKYKEDYVFNDQEVTYNPCPCVFCNNKEEPIIALEEEIERLTKNPLSGFNHLTRKLQRGKHPSQGEGK